MTFENTELLSKRSGWIRLQITELICEGINSSIQSFHGSFLCDTAGNDPDREDKRG
jgi:hypothetical protein